MVIEITTKSKPNRSSLIIGGGIICALMGIIILSAFLYFTINIKNMGEDLQEKAEVLTPLRESINQGEQKIIPIKQKIDNYRLLIPSHKSTSDIFTLLEEDCLPKVWFYNFGFMLEDRKVIVSGITDSFTTFEQQIFVLNQNLLVSDLAISNVFINENKEIDFTIEIVFESSILIPELTPKI